MQYLVDMQFADSGRAMTPQEGLVFIEHYVLPSLEYCNRLQREKKIVGGGPRSGAIALVLIVEANSALELDEIIENIPLWPRMRTTVTPLTTFDDRARAVRPRIEHIKARIQASATPA